MMDRDEALIEEAIRANFKDVGDKSKAEYQADLFHYADYLHSVFKVGILKAEREHVRAFMNHLKDKGGQDPAASRIGCSWCKARGFPEGRKGKPLSPSRRKKYLSALRFVYHHTLEASGWPTVDPTNGLPAPTVDTKYGFVPERADMKKLLEANGDIRGKMLSYFLYYVPVRREEARNVKWSDIAELDSTRPLVEIHQVKGGGRATYWIAPALRVMLREYRAWQLNEAKRNPRLADALAHDDSAFLFMSKTGKQLHASSLNKMINRRAVKAGIALEPCECQDSVDGYCSKVTPHVFRRTWANYAINDPKSPVTIDVVSKALGHSDIGTTRRHYADTDDSRVMEALLDDRL